MNSISQPYTRNNSVSTFFRNHQILLFFILTYIITWIMWVPLIPYSHANVGLKIEDLPPIIAVLLFSASFGPVLSALFVSVISNGKISLIKNIKKVFNWRINWRWYLIVIFLPFIWLLSSKALFVITSGGEFSNPIIEPIGSYIGLFLMILFIGGGNEEVGWRGFVTPRLQAKYRPMTANIIVGLFWGLWHLPLYFVTFGTNFLDFSKDFPGAILVILVALASTILWSIVFAWVYNNTKSIFLVMLMHSFHNLFNGIFALSWGGVAVEPYELLILLIVVIVLFVKTNGDLSYRETRARDESEPLVGRIQ